MKPQPHSYVGVVMSVVWGHSPLHQRPTQSNNRQRLQVSGADVHTNPVIRPSNDTDSTVSAERESHVMVHSLLLLIF